MKIILKGKLMLSLITVILLFRLLSYGQEDTSSKQYHTLAKAYRQKSLALNALGQLAITAQDNGEMKFADSVAKEYKEKYLEKLPTDSLCTRENLQFITTFYQLVNTSDAFFKLFCKEGRRVDSIMKSISPLHGDYSQNRINYLINREEIDSRLWEENNPITPNPDWNEIEKIIYKKYDSIINVKTSILNAKTRFYLRIKDWEKYAEAKDQSIKEDPPKTKQQENGNWMGDAWELNGSAWNVFLYCNDRKVLRKALSWSELSIRLEEPEPNVQYFDTKANLLYKLGKVKKAIATEQLAIEIGIQNAGKRGVDKGDFFDEYSDNLNKMRKGFPTWPTDH